MEIKRFSHKDKVITYNNTNKTSKIAITTNIPKDYSRVFQFYLEPYPIIFIRNGHFRYNYN